MGKNQCRIVASQDTHRRLLRLNFHRFDDRFWWWRLRSRRKAKLDDPQQQHISNGSCRLIPSTSSLCSFVCISLILIMSFCLKKSASSDVGDQIHLQITQAERFKSAHQAPRTPRYLAPLNSEPIVINSIPGLNPGQVIVPGSNGNQGEQATQVIYPYDTFVRNFSSNNPRETSSLSSHSYMIGNKRFVEAFSTRCLASTILENPSAVEPSFIIVRPNSEIRLNATIPAEFIRLAGFEPQKPTTIIIHGFTQSYPRTSWLRKVRALFEVHSLLPKHNLIIMDWGKASQGSYAQVAAMVSGMGSFLANFIMNLLDLGADRMSIHIIGHSLGAHLAGFAGKRIRPRLGRITGLDNAGPCFGKVFLNSAQDRLSADDAFEVDVYHYDDDFLGLPGQHGQFDIYVNDGRRQPGCSDNLNSVFQALLTMIFRRNRVLSESHTRSTQVSTSRLGSTGCQQVAYECRNYMSFKAGECGKCDDSNSQCFLMGFNFQYPDMDTIPLRTSFPGKRLYIMTNSNELYCLNHYQILVKLETGNKQKLNNRKTNKLELKLELYGDLGKVVDLTIANQVTTNVFSYLLLTELQPILFRSARLQIHSLDNGSSMSLISSPLGFTGSSSLKSSNNSGAEVSQIEVNFMSHVNPNVRRAMSSRLCPASNHLFDTSASPNSINVDSSDKAWLHFDECFPPPPITAPMLMAARPA